MPLWPFLVAGDHYRYEDFSSYRAHHFEQRFGDESYDVWGQTANILFYLASVVYGRAPEFQLKPDGRGNGAKL